MRVFEIKIIAQDGESVETEQSIKEGLESIIRDDAWASEILTVVDVARRIVRRTHPERHGQN